jgi:hypothetical protein
MAVGAAKEESAAGLRKAAMLLVVLGEQASAELLQQLSEEDVQKVSREVARITSISGEQAERPFPQGSSPSMARMPVISGWVMCSRSSGLAASPCKL